MSSVADDTADSTRYFIPASTERTCPRMKAASATIGSDANSSET